MNAFKIILAVIIISTSSQLDAQITIGPPISVTNGDDSFGFRSPKVMGNGEGEAIVFWVKTGSGEGLYVSRLTVFGFTEAVNIPLNGINPNIWSGNLGPDMATHGNHVYATFEKYGDAIYVVHSADYGVTWDDPVAAFTPPSGRYATIPSIAVDNNGQPFIIYVNTNNAEADAYYGLVKSNDFGTTFLSEVEVNTFANGEEVCECCNGDISIADNGDVFVAFRNNDDNLRDNWIARSIDGGESFTLAYDVDETDWQIFACPSNGPNVMVDGNLAVCTFYTGSTDWDNGAYYAGLDLATGEVGPTMNVPFSNETTTNQNSPRIAGTESTIAIITQEQVNGGANISLTISTTGIDGLNSESILINESEDSQRYPAIDYDGGKFHIVYEQSASGTVIYQEIVAGPNSIPDLEKSNYSIYPNPASDVFSIEGLNQKSENVEIQIVDLSGKELKNESLNFNSNQMSVRGLENGVYVVIISTAGNQYFSKLIVAN